MAIYPLQAISLRRSVQGEPIPSRSRFAPVVIGYHWPMPLISLLDLAHMPLLDDLDPSIETGGRIARLLWLGRCGSAQREAA